ncbi:MULTISPECIES: hypothetical protein [unclassified Methylobacterium]|uniref:hypothetical protein n=1 Tax=unclassified Methylobacterium TaxID=2615210 RepID=UPI002269E7DD|nr:MULTISPECIES: hypothetical protein [unclassified Methylobacterium]
MRALVGNGLMVVEQRLATLDEVELRLIVGIVAAAILAICPNYVALVLGWGGLIRYAPRAIGGSQELDQLRAACAAAQAAATEAGTALDDACERIVELERNLAAARAAVRPAQTSNLLYHCVGLHEGSPTFLIEAARRAFRARLHPDRHPPRHHAEAHRRFVQAEQAFAVIFAKRGIKG